MIFFNRLFNLLSNVLNNIIVRPPTKPKIRAAQVLSIIGGRGIKKTRLLPNKKTQQLILPITRSDARARVPTKRTLNKQTPRTLLIACSSADLQAAEVPALPRSPPTPPSCATRSRYETIRRWAGQKRKSPQLELTRARYILSKKNRAETKPRSARGARSRMRTRGQVHHLKAAPQPRRTDPILLQKLQFAIFFSYYLLHHAHQNTSLPQIKGAVACLMYTAQPLSTNI